MHIKSLDVFKFTCKNFGMCFTYYSAVICNRLRCTPFTRVNHFHMRTNNPVKGPLDKFTEAQHVKLSGWEGNSLLCTFSHAKHYSRQGQAVKVSTFSFKGPRSFKRPTTLYHSIKYGNVSGCQNLGHISLPEFLTIIYYVGVF